jgi:hypothetical protein
MPALTNKQEKQVGTPNTWAAGGGRQLGRDFVPPSGLVTNLASSVWVILQKVRWQTTGTRWSTNGRGFDGGGSAGM